MAKMNFGGVEENVVTREEFTLEMARETLAGRTIAVIGYGVQGPGQSLNLKDNGFKVIVGQRKGKTYVKINDYERLRQLFAQLLAEVQRIKSEGDYEAARQLVENYGVKVDQKLHAEVLKRYEALHLAPYKGFINPVYTPQFDAQGRIVDVTVSYDEAYDAQMLRYSRDYNTLPDVND